MGIFRRGSAARELLRLLLKWIPRKRSLQGTWIHRVLGDRIFNPDLWRITARGAAGGIAIGIFIGFTPTFPLQMMLSAILAYLFRVNVPLALAACWVTNPVTMPIIYALEYKLGGWLSSLFGFPDIAEFQKVLPSANEVLEAAGATEKPSFMKKSMNFVKDLIFGSLVFASLFSAISYFVVYYLVGGFFKRRKIKKLDMLSEEWDI